MLRGPQTVGELRGRTERMHEFADMDEAEHVLHSLETREDPLVAPMARGRWAQLLGGPVTEGAQPEEHVALHVDAGRSALEERIEALEREVMELKREFESFRRQFQ
jgi:hypothetical protein